MNPEAELLRRSSFTPQCTTALSSSGLPTAGRMCHASRRCLEGWRVADRHACVAINRPVEREIGKDFASG